MQSVNVTMIPKLRLALVLLALPFLCFSQENSPYSRYGIGNLTPQGNISNRGMGGISAGFSDVTTVNFLNPASYGNLIYTTLEIAAQADSKALKTSSDKFTSNNAYVPYLQLGLPLLNGNKKAMKSSTGWGIAFGLRQVSRISYKIEADKSLTNIDSLATVYEGNGGVYEASIGTGLRLKYFSIGFNTGYLFGDKDYSTRLIFINDTVTYHSSNSATNTNFGGLFFNAGFQYIIPFKKDHPENGLVRIGAYGTLQKKYNATQDILRETFSYNATTGNPDRLDSVYENNSVKGTVQLPATYGAGFVVEKKHVVWGIDFETTNWNNYIFYNQRDSVKKNWTVKAGFQYLPADVDSRKYWDFVKYRAGLFFGPDYINLGTNIPQFGISLGAGLPLKLNRSFYETQYSVMNVGIEYTNRGNRSNAIRESIISISVGFSLSDIWFRRVKYE